VPGIRTGAGLALEQHHTMTPDRCRFCAIPPAHADAEPFTIFDHNPDMPIKPPFRSIGNPFATLIYSSAAGR